MSDSPYWLMDGRANDSIDEAQVLETCASLEEAYKNWNSYGADTCIVDAEAQKVMDCLLWHNAPCPKCGGTFSHRMDCEDEIGFI